MFTLRVVFVGLVSVMAVSCATTAKHACSGSDVETVLTEKPMERLVLLTDGGIVPCAGEPTSGVSAK